MNSCTQSLSPRFARGVPPYALALLIGLLVATPSALADIGPVIVPTAPDGDTWIVFDESQTPGSWEGFTAKAQAGYTVQDTGDHDGTWVLGEPLLLSTASMAYAHSFLIPYGTAIQQTDSEFRIPFTVPETASYDLDVVLQLDQVVSDLHAEFIGLSRPSYVVANRVRIVAETGNPDSVLYTWDLSYDEKITDFGTAITEAALEAFLALLGPIFDLPSVGDAVFEALSLGMDVLTSGADPDATYQAVSHHIEATVQLNAGTQYYLSIRTEQWCFAQIFALLGFQWTLARTDLQLHDVALRKPIIQVAENSGSPDDDTLEYGEVATSDERNEAFTIGNVGTSDLSLDSWISTHPAFTLAPANPVGPTGDITLAPGETFTITVTFAPEELGEYMGTVGITSNDTAHSPYNLALSGTGVEGGGSGRIPPAIQILRPIIPEDFADEVYQIIWTDSDPDSDALIYLYRDTDDTFQGSEPMIVGQLHEDDDTYAGDSYFWDTSGVPEGVYYVMAIIDDGISSVVRHSAGTVRVEHPDEGDSFDVTNVQCEEDGSDSDGDGIVEGGERAELDVTIRNESEDPCYYVRCTLTSLTLGITVLDSEVYYGTIEDGHSSDGQGDFEFESGAGFSGVAQFSVRIEYESGGQAYVESETVYATVYCSGCGPIFQVTQVVFDDTEEGDGDGIPESGEESIRYYVYIRNIGTASAFDVDVEVADVTQLELGDRIEDYPDLPAGGSAQPPADGDYFTLNKIPASFTGTVSTNLIVRYNDPQQEQVIQSYPLFPIAPAAWLATQPREVNFGVTSSQTDVVQQIQIQNVGTAPLTVTDIERSHGDTTYSGITLPATLPAGATVTFTATIKTAGLQGTIERTVTVVSPDARLGKPGVNVTTIHGLVSDTAPDNQLTALPSSEHFPDVDGNLIAWEDTRNGGSDIYAYDLATGEEFAVCVASGDQAVARVEGQFIGWFDARSGNWDVYVYDTASGTEMPVATGSADEKLIGIDGDRVFYARHDHTIPGTSKRIFNLYYYDISDHATTQLTTYAPSGYSTVYSISPYAEGDCDGGLVTFLEFRHWWTGSSWNSAIDGVYKMQIGVDPAPVKIRPQAWDVPSTDTCRVVWGGDDNYGALDHEQVFMWTCGGGLTQLTTEETNHTCAVISADYVVYRKNSATGLFYWDLGIGQERAAVLGDTVRSCSQRINGHLLVWSDNRNGSWDIYYKYLDLPDIALDSADIAISDPEPLEGHLVDVAVTVHNVTTVDFDGTVTVRLYDGNPDEGGTQIGSDQTISGGLPAYGQQVVVFGAVPVGIEGTRTWYVRLYASGDPPGNNTAHREFTVGDSDVTPPVIANISATEYMGDGEGLLEDDEQVQIAWQLSDASGISTTTCTIDGIEYLASGTYYVIVGPFPAGEKSFTITATDADLSPESSTAQGQFQIVAHAPHVTGVTPADGTVDVPLIPLIAAMFDVALDATTVSGDTVSLSAGGAPVAGTVSYDVGGKRIVFQPTDSLEASTTYTMTLTGGSGGIHDTNGNALESDYAWSFTTVPDTTLPTAVISTPVAGAVVWGTVGVFGSAWDENFDHYELLVGPGSDPADWTSLTGEVADPVLSDLLGVWDTAAYTDAAYTLKLVVVDDPPASHVVEVMVTVQLEQCTPVAIVTAPVGVGVCAGSAAQFNVVATGTPELEYLWYKNGVPLQGEIGASLLIDAVDPTDAGLYSVVVTNRCGSVGTAPVPLTVLLAPSIATQPESRSTCVGMPAVFSVTASGAEPLDYVWRKDGKVIPGAPSEPWFTIPAAQLGDVGAYDVVIANPCGTTTSDSAMLTVCDQKQLNVLLVCNKESDDVVAYRYVATTGKWEFLRTVAGPADGMDYASGVVVDTAGNFYASSVGTDSVMKFSLRTCKKLMTFSGCGLDAPVGLVLREPFDLLVSSYSGDSVVQYNLKTGDCIDDGYFVPPGSGGLSGSDHLLRVANGNILVASQKNGLVLEFDRLTGEYVRVRAKYDPPNCPLDMPAGMVLDSLGNLLVVSHNSHGILKYAPDGTCLGALVPPYSGGLSYPEGLAWAPDGHLFVTSRGGNGIWEYAADGTFVGIPIQGPPLNGPTALHFATICDADCNSNEIIDQWDIDLGKSTDLNHNGVPDECESIGDLNCDGKLDAFDIDPFVLALTDPAGYAAKYPDCDRMLADINGDGKVDAFDIDPFVALLTGG